MHAWKDSVFRGRGSRLFWSLDPSRHASSGSTLVSLSLRLKDLQGPVTRVKKKKKKPLLHREALDPSLRRDGSRASLRRDGSRARASMPWSLVLRAWYSLRVWCSKCSLPVMLNAYPRARGRRWQAIERGGYARASKQMKKNANTKERKKERKTART